MAQFIIQEQKIHKQNTDIWIESRKMKDIKEEYKKKDESHNKIEIVRIPFDGP